MYKILVVEDEKAISDLVTMSLELEEYQVEVAFDGEEGAKKIEEGSFDLALFDIMLPKYNGYELLEYAKTLKLPVIFLTAKAQLKDKIYGLDLGAWDYIVKPFEVEELLARVRCVLRKQIKEELIGDLTVNMEARTITRDNKEIPLTPKEFDLFYYLYKNRGRILTREQICESVWDKEWEPDTRTVDLHVQRIRKKLDLKEKIHTVHGVGYRMEEK